MFGWRKRRDGFEWKNYVRTTILVRRERRRQRIDEFRDAAIDNLKEVGRKGADAGAAGLDAAQAHARRGVDAAAAGAGQAFSALGGHIKPGLSRLRVPRSAGIAGAWSRFWAATARGIDHVRVTAGSWHLDSGLAQVALLLTAIVSGTTLYSWWSTPASAPQTVVLAATEAASTAKPPSQLSGKATATSGDILRVSDMSVRLGGIQAPDRGQACQRANGKSWDCGQAATQALTRLIRGKKVSCDLSGGNVDGLPLAKCRAGDDDIAAAMVSAGHAFAESGLFAAYTGLEAKAREEHAGIWAGEALRPADYRAQRWEDAKKAAPDGCPIKGQVTSGNRVYLLPWSPSYERVKVRSSRGERWFCSEKEAIAAGWKADPRTPRGSS